MPRLTDAVRQQRREHIADAAIRCFARQGFASTSMADIIAEAGLSSGSIYSHFDSKLELARFAASEAFCTVQESLTEGMARGERVDPATAFERIFDVITTQTGFHVLVQLWSEAQFDAELSAFAHEKMNLLRSAIAQALSGWAGSPERAAQTASLVLATMQGSVVRLAVESATPAAELRDELVAALRALAQ